MGPPSRREYLAALSVGLSGLAGCQSLRQGLPGSLELEAETPALLDTDPHIVVRDLDPETSIDLLARTNTRYDRWEARATFEADAEGVVRVSETPPVAGDYSGADGAGLIWSMSRTEGKIHPWPNQSFTVELLANREGQTVGRIELRRRQVSSSVRTRWVTDDATVGWFAEPDIETPRPGIVVLHGSDGSPMTGYAEMFASHGFPTLAVKYFGEEKRLPDDLEAVPLEYFDDAAAWLREQATVVDGPLGVYGFSRGGEAALLLASYADWVGAVVGDAPSGLVWQGIRSDGGTGEGSAWSLDGDPLPFVPYEGCSPEYTDSGLRRDAAFYECGLASVEPARIEAATIPLEQFEGPILCLSGASDGVWPSAQLTEFALDRLRRAGRDDQFTQLVYDDAGHRIPIPYVPTTGIPASGGWLIGGTPPGIARAAADSWPKILATFEALAD